MPSIENRIDTLESLLGQFIVNTDVALRRLEREMQAFKDEMRAFKNEMKDFKDEMKVFKDEMRAFKDEVKEDQKKRNQEWSNLAKKMGTLVEDLIAPALRLVLSKYFQCEVQMEGQRVYSRRGGESYEVDALAVCADRVFMVEVKSSPRERDIDEIQEKSGRFFEFFPEHRGKELVVIFGSVTFPEQVIRYGSRKGVYVMGYREWEYMDILNFEEVRKGAP